jgi:4-hydroxy-3-methylbut-2-enyl diphosphate reductase IspH
VIIRAHGVPPQDQAALRQAGFSKVIDGTCPRVVRVQAIIRRRPKQGRTVIVGDAPTPRWWACWATPGPGPCGLPGPQVADLPRD